MSDRDAYDALPKVELHCHVEGAVRPATVVELARKHGVTLPTSDPVELYRYHSLDSFLETFWLVQSLLRDADDWERASYEYLTGAAGPPSDQRPLGPLTLPMASVKSVSSWSPATAQSSVTSPAVMSVMRTQPGTSPRSDGP